MKIKWLSTLFAAVIAVSAPVLHAQDASSNDEEIGVFNTFQNRLPVTLWKPDDVPDVIGLLEFTEPSSFAAINALRNKLVLSSSRPKLTTADSEAVLAARLHLLYSNGALDGAEALLSAANWSPPIVRAEVEKVVLMTSRPDKYCAMLTANKFSEIDKGMKVYCLVRQDDYPAAKAHYDEKRQEWPVNRASSLLRFLELDENNPLMETPWDELPDPLEFVLDESFGRPRGSVPLPPAYEYFAREMGTSPLHQLEYTEDLTRTAALPANVLFSAYRLIEPDPTSDIALRADLIRQLTTPNLDTSNDRFRRLVQNLYYEFSNARLLDPMASQFAPHLGKIDLSTIEPSTRNTIMRLGLIGGWSQEEWVEYLPIDDYQLNLAFRIRHPLVNLEHITNTHLATPQTEKLHTIDFNYSRKADAANPSGLDILVALKAIENYHRTTEFGMKKAFKTLFDAGQFLEAQDIALSILFGGTAP